MPKYKATELDRSIFEKPKTPKRSASLTEFQEFKLSKSNKKQREDADKYNIPKFQALPLDPQTLEGKPVRVVNKIQGTKVVEFEFQTAKRSRKSHSQDPSI